ncbi:nucleotidyltransferase domain-containing protein [Zooshikella harenae]|uniref:MazG-related protein n=1 Tax=Zooshikella harenae TaxID=2827238 RepID=A0ABS5ZHI2_9GAMM|nr:MazG-related protein [Zooshikella harenae]MBU2712467.1 MazG-related protein [Zooshikella harenae]
MSEKVKKALIWIRGILESESIQYQVVGGLAVRIHGGTRPVADIDIYIPKSSASKLLQHVQPYISKPLTHYVEEAWDLEYFQLIYEGQKIEIGLSPGTKIFDKRTSKWLELEIDYGVSVNGIYEGDEVPVMPIPALVAYKSVLDRDVDRIDVAELTQTLAR